MLGKRTLIIYSVLVVFIFVGTFAILFNFPVDEEWNQLWKHVTERTKSSQGLSQPKDWSKSGLSSDYYDTSRRTHPFWSIVSSASNQESQFRQRRVLADTTIVEGDEIDQLCAEALFELTETFFTRSICLELPEALGTTGNGSTTSGIMTPAQINSFCTNDCRGTAFRIFDGLRNCYKDISVEANTNARFVNNFYYLSNFLCRRSRSYLTKIASYPSYCFSIYHNFIENNFPIENVTSSSFNPSVALCQSLHALSCCGTSTLELLQNNQSTIFKPATGNKYISATTLLNLLTKCNLLDTPTCGAAGESVSVTTMTWTLNNVVPEYFQNPGKDAEWIPSVEDDLKTAMQSIGKTLKQGFITTLEVNILDTTNATMQVLFHLRAGNNSETANLLPFATQLTTGSAASSVAFTRLSTLPNLADGTSPTYGTPVIVTAQSFAVSAIDQVESWALPKANMPNFLFTIFSLLLVLYSLQ